MNDKKTITYAAIVAILIVIVIILIIYYSNFDRNTLKPFSIHNNNHFTMKAIQHRKPIAKFHSTRHMVNANINNNNNNILNNEDDQLIPRIIIQTNEKDEIPKGMFSATKTILDYNPEYTYLYFNDVNSRKYIADHYSARILVAYDKLIPGAYKADLFRYCVLYKMGGIYIDMGMVARCPLRDVIRPTDKFISPEDAGHGYVYNAFICCIPHHPILKNAIDISVNNIERNNYGRNALDITGPAVFAKAVSYYLNNSKNIAGLSNKLSTGLSNKSSNNPGFEETNDESLHVITDGRIIANASYGEGIRIISYVKHWQFLSGYGTSNSHTPFSISKNFISSKISKGSRDKDGSTYSMDDVNSDEIEDKRITVGEIHYMTKEERRRSAEGDIYDGEIMMFTTRYHGYREDVKWYNTKKHYGVLWSHSMVFANDKIRNIESRSEETSNA